MTVERMAREHAVTMMLATPGTTQFVYDDRPMTCSYRGQRWVSGIWLESASWAALADWIDAVDREVM